MKTLKCLNDKYEILVDNDIYELLKNNTIYISVKRNVPYAYFKNNIYLSRFIVQAKRKDFVDHINGNTLDNRKCNLRLCTNADNLKNRVNLPKNNTSGILGVRFRKDRNKWYSELQVNNKTIRLGSYLTKEEAIKARKNGEEKYFKEYKSIINNK